MRPLPRSALHAIMIGVVVFWSGAFTMIKVALRDLTPLEVTALRFAVAVLPLAALLAWTGLPRFSRREWRTVALIAVLSVAGYHLALNYGETAVSAGVASLIVATGPIWTALLSAVVLGERVGALKVAGIALALAGVVTLVLGRGDALEVRYLVGALVVLAAPVMWAVVGVTSKPLVGRHDPLAFTAFTTLLGTLPLLPFAAAALPRAPSWDAWTWIALLHLGLLATVAGYVGFNVALRQLTATETMAYVYLNPVFALGWAAVLAREAVTPILVAGGALVLAGVALTQWRSAAPAPDRGVTPDAEAREEG